VRYCRLAIFLSVAQGLERLPHAIKEGWIVTSNLSAFCFVYPAQAVLNSTPQLLSRDRRAVVETQNFWSLVSGF